MKLEFIAANGQVLDLLSNPLFKIANIDGLTSVNVALAKSTTAGVDGSVITGRRTEDRTIILDLVIDHWRVESAVREILSYIKPKEQGQLRWTTATRSWVIPANVEVIDTPRTSEPPVHMQIDFTCPEPYWSDVDFIIGEVGDVIPAHYFTDDPSDQLFFTSEGQAFGIIDLEQSQTFVNEGDTSVGIIITIVALGTVINPKIYNLKGEFIGVNLTMSANQELVIDTRKMHKSIRLNGQNKLGSLIRGSTFLQMETGSNEFTILHDSDVDTGSCYFTIAYQPQHV